MPNPNLFLQKAGLCGRHELPTIPMYKVLKRLTCDANPNDPDKPPRLYVKQEGKRRTASVSYGKDATGELRGFSTRIPVDIALLHRWIIHDKERQKSCAPNVKVYKITNKGREVIAQMRTHSRYRRFVARVIPGIIKEERKRAGL